MISIQNYEDAERYLLSTIDERVSRTQPYRLERMRGFLTELGNPQLQFPVVHVGGTSGKGSTCTLVANVLQSAGHSTGLHVKPHLQSMTERARINGHDIAPSHFAEILAGMMPAIERAASRGERPSYYETLLTLAFCYFAQCRVDIAVIEVGLGGRLDGTNVVSPLVTAITSIGLDHTEVLGSTLTAIAAEKAGIAKVRVPMVVNIDDDGARDVVAQICAEVGAPFVDVATRPPSAYLKHLSLTGAFQRTNAMTALGIFEALPLAFAPSAQAISQGFAATHIPGRMECIARKPMTLLDIAHNAQKATALAGALREMRATSVRIVLSIAKSKDAAEIIAALVDIADEIICTTFPVQPGRTPIEPNALAELVRAHGCRTEVVVNPHEAYELARRRSGEDDLIVVTGSTLLVATIRERSLGPVSSQTC